MLSILIPIFNFDIRPLVADLHGQCEALGNGYEIVCFDDGSTADFKVLNKEVWKLTNVIYREMPQNLGRSAIRNALGKAARFENLLFMDCDSKVVSPDFLKKYVAELEGGIYSAPTSPDAGGINSALQTLIYGGRCYAVKPPADKSLYFHWHYGRYREQTTAADRTRLPYDSFMTNNFLIPKAIFLDILFDETLRQYGHEDTLFGMELAQRKVPIVHIDNPLEHIGLETTAIFLQKTVNGIENLVKLRKEGKPIKTRLTAVFDKMERWHLTFFLPTLTGFLHRRLLAGNHQLWLFDLYKLAVMKAVNSSQPLK